MFVFPKKKYCGNGEGFTLIETLLYLGLFAIVIGGGMVAAYQIIESTSATYNHVILQEEANFLIRKINWALTGSSILKPSSTSNTDLWVNKGGVYSFCLIGADMFLKLNSNGTPCTVSDSVLINSSNVAISPTPLIPLFERIITTGKPDAMKTSFRLTTVQNGREASQDFTFTKYLRINN